MIEQAPISPTHINFDMANLYVMTCYYNNKSDWRLPTPNENTTGGWNTSDIPYNYNDSSVVWRVTPVRNKC